MSVNLHSEGNNRVSDRTGESQAALYQVRVQGCLDDHWADWFEGLALTRDVAQDTTTLSGVLPDQAALHGLLAQIRDVGLTLLAVTRVD